jgi:hypothetical protein
MRREEKRREGNFSAVHSSGGDTSCTCTSSQCLLTSKSLQVINIARIGYLFWEIIFNFSNNDKNNEVYLSFKEPMGSPPKGLLLQTTFGVHSAVNKNLYPSCLTKISTIFEYYTGTLRSSKLI